MNLLPQPPAELNTDELATYWRGYATKVARRLEEATRRIEEGNDALAKLIKAEDVLRNILSMHDGNQPAELNMPDLDYARRVIRDIHAEARGYVEPRQ